MFNKYPYTDFHELNTDWIIGKIKNVETAEANTKQYAEDADAAKIAAQDARDIAVQAKDDAVLAKGSAENARDLAQNFATDAYNTVSNTQSQIALLQARVDNIIPDGTQTAGNTELIDIRTAADGRIYDSAGNAVRGQVTDLNTAIVKIEGTMDEILPVNWFNDNDTEVYDASFDYSNYIPVNDGDEMTYYYGNNPAALAHGTPRHWMYYDIDKNLLGQTAIWTQDYTVSGATIKYVRAVVSNTHNNRMIEINQTPAITIYSPYVAPYFIADDSVARNDIDNINGRINSLTYSGDSVIPGKYQKGSLASGIIQNLTYRVIEADHMSFPHVMMVYIANNFRLGVHFYNSGVFTYDSGWKTGYYVIPKNAEFNFVIARSVDDPSEDIADLNEFINAITFRPYLSNNNLNDNQCIDVISHQGYSVTSEYYGNSRISSFIGSYEHGFKTAECDIQWSSDGVPMCCHDATFLDTHDGVTIITIANHTAADLQTYGYYGETIATLEEVVSTCKQYGLRLELDKLSSSWTAAQWDTICSIISEYQMQKYIIWAVDDYISAGIVLAYDKWATLMMNTSDAYIESTIATAKALVTDDCNILIACNYSGFSIAHLISCNAMIPERNIEIGVWTIDDIPTFLQYMPYASFITSNKLSAQDVL